MSKTKMPKWQRYRKNHEDGPYAGIFEKFQNYITFGNSMGWDELSVEEAKDLVDVLRKSIEWIENNQK